VGKKQSVGGKATTATKVAKVFKAIKSLWTHANTLSKVIPCISVIATATAALLGRFIGLFTCIIESYAQIPWLVVIAISPFLIYAVIVMILSIIRAAGKPPHLKFTNMKYKDWQLKWNYNKRHEVDKIWPICRDCGCKLVEWEDPRLGGLRCPKCENHLYPEFDKYLAARTVIEHKIEKWSDKSVSIQPIPIEVCNTLSIPVTLYANDYLGTEPMTIPANSNDNSNTIYTKKPSFTIVAEKSPTTAVWQIVDNVILVTIR